MGESGPVIGLTSEKDDWNMVKKYFGKETSFNKEHNSNEYVFAEKKENNYMFLTTSKFQFFRGQKLHWTWVEL